MRRLHAVHHLRNGSKLRHLLLGGTEVSFDLKMLLLISGLFGLGLALSNTFVNIFLWKQQSEYMTIATYNLFIVLSQPLTFIVAGKMAKQVDRVLVLRIGIFFMFIFFLTVLLLGDSASQFAILLGVISGIGFGFYWLAFNVLTFEITEPVTRDIFNGFFGLLHSFAGMTGPFVAGWIISRLEEQTGYYVIFTTSMILFISAVCLSFLLQKRRAEGKYELLRVIRWREISAPWQKILLANAAQGLREGSFVFLITIWIFVSTGTEMALGIFSLITSALALVVYYMAGRFIRQHCRKLFILIAAIILSASVFIIAFELNFTRLMTYGVITSIAFPMLMVPFLSMSLDVIGRAKNAREWRVEYIVGRELFLNTGRLLSIVFFMGIVLFLDLERMLPAFMIIFGNAQLLLYVLIRRI